MKLVNRNNNKCKVVNFKRIYYHYADVVFLYNWLKFRKHFLQNYSKFSWKVNDQLKMLLRFDTVYMLPITWYWCGEDNLQDNCEDKG